MGKIQYIPSASHIKTPYLPHDIVLYLPFDDNDETHVGEITKIWIYGRTLYYQIEGFMFQKDAIEARIWDTYRQTLPKSRIIKRVTFERK